MPAPTRSQVIAQIDTLKAKPPATPVTGEEWGAFERMFLDYLDREGTFDITNTMASFATVVDQNTDFNTLTTSGIYGCSAASAWVAAKFAPVGHHTAGSLLVIGSGNRVTQVFVPHQRAALVFRNKVGASDWGPWHNGSGLYSLPNGTTNNVWVKLGTFTGGVTGERATLSLRAGQQYSGGVTTFQLAAVIEIHSGNGGAGVPNCGALFYNAGGGSLVAKLKAVKIAPVSGTQTDTVWTVYGQFDQFMGNGYYEVGKTPTCGWVHDGSLLAGAPPESTIFNGTEQYLVASPVYLLGDVNAPNLPTHASDAAAGTAGLAAGKMYKHSDGSVHVKL